MNEALILKAIADACEDDTLHFQLIVRGSALHIYINRPTSAQLNYQELKQRIYLTIISLYPSKVAVIWLYCRVLGEIEPDWQSVLEIDPSNSVTDEIASSLASLSTAVEATNVIVDKIERELNTVESFTEDFHWEIDDLPTTADDSDGSKESAADLELADSELDFSQYCFIRNQRLLYALLDPPPETIARLIDTFESYNVEIKRSQLPILSAYFEGAIEPEITDFEPEVRQWWAEVEQLDSEVKRKLAIWLSRYCLAPEPTLSVIGEILARSSNSIKTEVEQSSASSLSNSNLNNKQNLLSNLITSIRRLLWFVFRK